MTLAADERANSPEISFEAGKTRAKRVWWIGYTDNEGEVLTLARALMPPVYAGQPLQKFKIDHQGAGVWDLEAEWGQKDTKDAAEQQGEGQAASFTWDTTGGTEHITQSISTVASYALNMEEPPDHGGAIGVSDDSIEGLDVTRPTFSWTETHFLPQALVTWDYLFILRELTGKVNQDVFRSRFSPGEVQFLGSTGTVPDLLGQTLADEKVEATFKFSAKPNVGVFWVGEIEVTDGKKGWDYMWIEYRSSDDAGAKRRIKQPFAVHIEQVFPRGDFIRLGIGT